VTSPPGELLKLIKYYIYYKLSLTNNTFRNNIYRYFHMDLFKEKKWLLASELR